MRNEEAEDIIMINTHKEGTAPRSLASKIFQPITIIPTIVALMTLTIVLGYLRLNRDEPVFWNESRFPLVVVLDDTAPELEGPLRLAIDKWNATCRHELFSFMGLADHGVLIERSDVHEVSVVKAKSIMGSDARNVIAKTDINLVGGGIDTTRVLVLAAIDPDLVLPALIHELGHALGMVHSNRMSSVMYEDTTKGHVLISDDDMRALHSAYSAYCGASRSIKVTVSEDAQVFVTEGVTEIRVEIVDVNSTQASDASNGNAAGGEKD